MSHAYDALVNRLQRLDKWISETDRVAANATDPETRQQIEADIARWKQLRRECDALMVRWKWLNKATSAILAVIGFSVVALFAIASFESLGNKFQSLLLGIDYLLLFASIVAYVLVIAARDSIGHREVSWRFSLRSVLIAMTVIALVLGELAWLSRRWRLVN